MALALLAVIQVADFVDQQAEQQDERTRLALGVDAEKIRYYDELLTTSARLAAATGDHSYVDRYNAAAPQLDQIISTVQVRTADPGVTAALAATAKANEALVALEAESFAQLAAGNQAAAYATLDGGVYHRLKGEYAAGLDGVLARMDGVAAESDAETQGNQRLELLLSSALITIILALWAATAAGLRRTARARDEAEEQLRRQALHDPLTGLANRLLLSHRIELASRRQHGLVALFYVDLDDFKLVNDEHGHQAGDVVLIEVAHRLQACARPKDLVARLGGDEFAVLVEDLPGDDEVRALGQRFSAALSPPIVVEGTLVWCGASIGSAILDEALVESTPEPEDLLLKADLAMYQAKSAGKGRVMGFEKQMYEDVLRDARLKTDIRDAFQRQELVVWYQAVVDLRRGSMTGVEALVRWNHPHRGLLTPDEFLPQVAATGLQAQLTRFVLREACCWAQHRRATFPDEAPLTMAVNVSPQELHTAELSEEITRVLSDTGFPASLLIMEVTETGTFEQLEEMLPALTAIRAMGVTVAVDDFGTGHSSLSHLREFPVDLVKIDKSFVAGLGTSLEDSMVVAAVVRLAHTMSLPAVAEGVEEVKQLAALRALECEFVQGYLLARPAPGDDVPRPGDIERRFAHLGLPSPRSAPAVTTFTVLIADDVEEERDLLRRMLERSGRFQVVAEAADGIDAVTLATTFMPQVVLLDLDMPRLDGMSALPLIAAAAPASRVVVLSGRATDTLLAQARRIGAAACMEKGIADIPASLLTMLEAAP